MHIARHAIDTDHAKRLFSDAIDTYAKVWEHRNYDPPWEGLPGTCHGLYRAGGVVNPSAEEVRLALLVAGQFNAAILACYRHRDPPLVMRIGTNSSASFSKAVDESLVDTGRWIEGCQFATIARQPVLREILLSVPAQAMRRSTTRGGEEAFQFCELYRSLASGELSVHDPCFQHVLHWAEEQCRTKTRLAKSCRGLLIPFLRVVERFLAGDREEFDSAIASAIQSHKKYWSSTNTLRRDTKGWVSIQLTAIMALAWDAGVQTNVESEYTPRPWVTGSWPQ